LSKPFADNAVRPLQWRLLAAGTLALTLAACGASTPRAADVDAPEVAVPPPAVTRTEPVVEPVVAEEPERRRDRRSERRAADAATAEAAAGILEPVPEAAAAAYERALAAIRSENWLEAELELEQLTLEHPEYPGPHVNLALVYLNDERRDDGRAALERALEIDPNHAAANTQLGILLREDGEFAAAEQAYRRALEANRDYGLAHYNLGVLLDLYLRRTSEALEHYEAYQASLAAPNETVARWIIDLRRRVGNVDAARVAQEDGP
jgi:tetratricopeptide (TPR) repeat protein